MCTGIEEVVGTLVAAIGAALEASASVAPELGLAALALEGGSLAAACLGSPDLAHFLGIAGDLLGAGAGIGGITNAAVDLGLTGAVGAAASSAAAGAADVAGGLTLAATTTLEDVTNAFHLISGIASLGLQMSGDKKAAEAGEVFGLFSGFGGSALAMADTGASALATAQAGIGLYAGAGALGLAASGDLKWAGRAALGAGFAEVGVGFLPSEADSGTSSRGPETRGDSSPLSGAAAPTGGRSISGSTVDLGVDDIREAFPDHRLASKQAVVQDESAAPGTQPPGFNSGGFAPPQMRDAGLTDWDPSSTNTTPSTGGSANSTNSDAGGGVRQLVVPTPRAPQPPPPAPPAGSIYDDIPDQSIYDEPSGQPAPRPRPAPSPPPPSRPPVVGPTPQPSVPGTIGPVPIIPPSLPGPPLDQGAGPPLELSGLDRATLMFHPSFIKGVVKTVIPGLMKQLSPQYGLLTEHDLARLDLARELHDAMGETDPAKRRRMIEDIAKRWQQEEDDFPRRLKGAVDHMLILPGLDADLDLARKHHPKSWRDTFDEFNLLENPLAQIGVDLVDELDFLERGEPEMAGRRHGSASVAGGGVGTAIIGALAGGLVGGGEGEGVIPESGATKGRSGGNPAVPGDPWSPEQVAARTGTIAKPNGPLAAKALGYEQRIAPQKIGFDPHGQPVYSNGETYITPDVDAHAGGVWKMFDRRGNRLGTYDIDLRKIGP